MSDDKKGSHFQDHHNQGEKDAAEGKYNPPHTISPLGSDIFSTKKDIEHYQKDNEAYNEGHRNVKK
jgi:hypothetical protein